MFKQQQEGRQEAGVEGARARVGDVVSEVMGAAMWSWGDGFLQTRREPDAGLE